MGEGTLTLKPLNCKAYSPTSQAGWGPKPGLGSVELVLLFVRQPGLYTTQSTSRNFLVRNHRVEFRFR